MNNTTLKKYYVFSLLGILLASIYPLYMGIKVGVDMIKHGTVFAENYPKYIIPYTPISISLIVGVALMMIFIKYTKKLSLLFSSVVSTIMFFVTELILENMVIVTKTVTTTLESWQMYMCYVPSTDRYVDWDSGIASWTEVDVLMGEYSPAFKLHFYIISIVIIISLLNCFYGFANMIKTKETSRYKSLIIQSISSVAFLGMCIWACFTAFYRTGAILVSPLSAFLMSIFFILLGVTVGIYIISFTLNKKKLLSIFLPSISASLVTLIMYIGEMFLLNGHLYRFGSGFLFNGISGIVLAPFDILIILLSGGITVITSILINKTRKKDC